MMKLGLALLAIGAAATRISDGVDWFCSYDDWSWEECSGLYWQHDCEEHTYECGWWYSNAADDDWSDDWWVT